MNWISAAKKIETTLIAHRRYLHQNPEIHDELPLTTRYVEEVLEDLDIDYDRVSKSGIVASIKGHKQGASILLRADMDALPIEEKAHLPYRSVNGNMHACGHDFHTAMLLGAAKLLKENVADLSGTVHLMFQPAEETLIGAKAMIEDGLFERYHIQAAMMIHVFSMPGIEPGKLFYLTDGYASASCDAFKIIIQGSGGHGAMPHATIDPLVAMSHIHLGLLTMAARETNQNDFLIISPCLLKGGSSANIVPDSALIEGTIRTFNPNIRTQARKRLETIAVNTGKAHRCKVDVDFHKACPSVLNDKALRDELSVYAQALFGDDNVIDAKKITLLEKGRISGSEDFGYISEQVPSVMFIMSATQSDEQGKTYTQHHPKVMFDESVLHKGAALYASSAFQWLNTKKS